MIRKTVRGIASGTQRWVAESGADSKFVNAGSYIYTCFMGVKFPEPRATVVDVAANETIFEWSGHVHKVPGTIFRSDGKFMVANYTFHDEVWDATSRTCLYDLQTQSSPHFRFIGFIPNGNLLIHYIETLHLVDVTNGQIMTAMNCSHSVSKTAFNSDGNLFAVSTYFFAGMAPNNFQSKGELEIWDVARAERRLVLDGHHRERVNYIAWSPDDRFVATGFEDGVAVIWNAQTGESVDKLMFRDGVRGVAFSNNGALLLAHSLDCTQVWSTVTKKMIHKIGSPSDVMVHAAFSPNGKQLLTSSHDSNWNKTTTVWQREN